MKKLVFIVTLLFMPSVYGASYSFQDCLNIVDKNNAELLAAKENLEAAKSLLSGTYGSFLPDITANLKYSRGQTDLTSSEGYNANLTATENIFNGFADVASISDAEGKVQVAEANLRTVKAKISADLKSAFASVVYAQDSIKLSKSILKRRTDNFNIVKLRFQSGRENKGSVLLSEAYQKQAQLDVLKAEHALQTAKRDLGRVLGLAPEASLEIIGQVPELTVPGVSPDFLALAEKTPSRQQSQGQLKSADANLQGARSKFYPTLNLQGSVGRTGEDFFPDNNQWSAGATLSWSLFNGGTDYFTQKSSFAQKMVAEHNLRNLYLETITQLRETYAAFVEAVEEVKVSAAFSEAASTRAEIARSKYNNGLSSFDDWDVIENDLINRQKDLTTKKRARVVAEANWEKTQGVGVLP
ncbi:MAG: FusA/NodT family protein [Bdellovibrio sp. ArHS]|uniref:TolC family protein n=1 Tax=Bdellovibrio sp. ArHS TaxID=1569284 RepID=UPI000583C39C|nr:TolC family protein [Bdellovibrio sp. ArHS]KHD87943.1 MAG: FusA/NodT family protein [Bdellovibrio sp. ArHS]